MRLRSNLGNNSKRGARQCGSDDSDNLNNVGGGKDLGNDESDAVKIEFWVTTTSKVEGDAGATIATT